MTKKGTIIQPNRITNAKYNYTAVQKNVMYHVLGHLQNKMTKTRSETLFGEEILTIPLKVLEPNKNYKRIMDEAKAMINIHIDYEHVTEKGRKEEVLTTLFSSVIHERGSDNVKFVIPSYALPVLCNISEGGFTRYRKLVALNLRSVYTKRLYELCCKWEDKGGFKMDLAQFREMLSIPKSYQNGNIKQRILDKSKEELKDQADLYYEYDIVKGEKEGRRNAYENVHFKIIKVNRPESKAELKELMQSKYGYLYRYFMKVFPGNALAIVDEINQKDYLEIAYDRFGQLDDEYSNGTKKLEDITKLSRFILKQDYGIEFVMN